MNTGLIVLIACSVLVFVGTNAMLIGSHENAHVQIFAIYGIDSEVEYGLTNAKTVISSGWEDLSREDMRFVSGLQALNEVFFYQIFAMFNCLMFFAVFIALAFKATEKEEKK